MRTKTIKRHYCDFCSKGSFRKDTMLTHEVSCTKNPQRKCFLCEESRDYASLIPQVKTLGSKCQFNYHLLEVDGQESMDKISDLVDGCPACILAVLQQSGVMAWELFEYKKARDEWHKEKNLPPYYRV